MNGIPRIRALLPGSFHRLSPRLPSPARAGDAPQVFRNFGRTLERLDRAAATRRPNSGGEGA